MISAVFFDIGEVVVDESQLWGRWADRLGVPRHTFSAVFGATIARGQRPSEAFRIFGINLDDAIRAREGEGADFDADDLYPDVRQCLIDLQDQGLRVGLAGNQRRFAEAALWEMNLAVNVIGTSSAWGVDKPSAAFFERVAIEAGCPISQVLYVGDRLDNDIRPAQEIGMPTALIRRGPWGYILDDPEALDRCLFCLNSLAELPPQVRAHNVKGRQ